MQREDLEALIEQTHHPHPKQRREAVLGLCPCHVRADVPEVWDRMFEMEADPDAGVRSLVLHTLCDGSPATRRDEVVAAVERLQKDPDPRLRRRARRALAEFRRTGNINVM